MTSYTGFLVRQRAGATAEFLVFVAKAKEVVTWAEADNIKLGPGNVQRELVESRWRQIKKFFAANPNNVIPTSVTIALDDTVERVASVTDLPGRKAYVLETVSNDLKRITFGPEVVGSAFIIDGQHRLRGMSEVEGDVLVPVCLFVDLPTIERAFQFVTINNKSHKVPTSNLKSLIANFEAIESPLKSRLTQASITAPQFASAVDVLNEDTDSPFHKMVDWVNNRHDDGVHIVPPTALENSLKAIVRAFPETKDDEGDALAVLYAIWKAVFALYGITYANAPQFPNLMLKATIQKISEMVVDKLRSDYDPAFTTEPVMGDNGSEAGRTARALVGGIPADFWTRPWAMKSLDTSAGRALIEEGIRELKKLIRDGGMTAEEAVGRVRLNAPAGDIDD